jgi:hypothetical protein
MGKASAVKLATLLRKLIRDYGGTKKDFGHTVLLDSSTISHLLSGDAHYVLGVEPCLRIAAVTGSSPSALLRAAGKADVAALLEQLYGKPVLRRMPAIRLSPDERRGLKYFRALDPRTRNAFIHLLGAAASSGVPQHNDHNNGRRRREARARRQVSAA